MDSSATSLFDSSSSPTAPFSPREYFATPNPPAVSFPTTDQINSSSNEIDQTAPLATPDALSQTYFLVPLSRVAFVTDSLDSGNCEYTGLYVNVTDTDVSNCQLIPVVNVASADAPADNVQRETESVVVEHDAAAASSTNRNKASDQRVHESVQLTSATPYNLQQNDRESHESSHLKHLSGPFVCDVCAFRSGNSTVFGVHKERWKNAPHYRCNICDGIYDRIEKLRAHEKCCTSMKQYKCDCGEMFNREINYKLHVSTHNLTGKELRCPLCQKIFRRAASYRCHLKLHAVDDLLQCDQCDEEFTTAQELQRHASISHSAVVQVSPMQLCKQCGALFKRPLELAEHLITHKKIKETLRTRYRRRANGAAIGRYKCEICRKTYAKKSTFDRHSLIHTGERPFACKVCKKSFNQKGALLFHEAKHLPEKPFKCQLCGVGFNQKGNLRTHVKRVHPATVCERTSSQECPLCSCTLKSLQALNAHISKRHKDLLDTLTNVCRPDQGVFVEQTASAVDTNNDQLADETGPMSVSSDTPTVEQCADMDPLQLHEFQDSRLKTRKQSQPKRHLQCLICEKEFAKPSDLTRHTRTHSGERPFGCQICTKRFALRSTLENHIRTRHLGVKAARCGICLKELSNAYTLEMHMRLHLTEKLSCKLCRRKFRKASALEQHLQKHDVTASSSNSVAGRSQKQPLLDTDVGLVEVDDRGRIAQPCEVAVRPFACPYCPMMFKKKSHVVEHKRSHENFRPYVCRYGVCGRAFFTAGAVRDHAATHSGVRAHICQICRKRFTCKRGLVRHMIIHSTVRPFVCPHCGKRFKRGVLCRRHMKTHKDAISVEQPEGQETVFDEDWMVQQQMHQELQQSEQQFQDQPELQHCSNQLGPQQAQNTHEQGATLPQAWTTPEVTQLPENTLLMTEECPEVISNLDALTAPDVEAAINCFAAEWTPIAMECQTQNAVAAELQLATGTGCLPNIDWCQAPIEFETQEVDHETSVEIQMPSGQETFVGFSLDAHQSTFQNEIFECDNCQMFFDSVVALREHSKEHARKYSCPECGQTFTHAIQLNRHAYEAHPRRQTVDWDQQQRQLQHQQQHQQQPQQQQQQQHSEQQIPYYSVDNGYARHPEPFVLDQHQSTSALLNMTGQLSLAQINNVGNSWTMPSNDQIMVDNEKTIQSEEIVNAATTNDGKRVCMYCSKAFKKPSDLIRHLRIHTGEKPFQCECGRAFRLKSALHYHQKTHESNRLMMHRCNVCNRMFASRGSLKAHLRQHTSEKRFWCSLCQESCSTSVQLNRHVIRKHGNLRHADVIELASSQPQAPHRQQPQQHPQHPPFQQEYNQQLQQHAPVYQQEQDHLEMGQHPHRSMARSLNLGESSAFTPVTRQTVTHQELADDDQLLLQMACNVNNELQLDVRRLNANERAYQQSSSESSVIIDVGILRDLAQRGVAMTIPVDYGSDAQGGSAGVTSVTVNPETLLEYASGNGASAYGAGKSKYYSVTAAPVCSSSSTATADYFAAENGELISSSRRANEQIPQQQQNFIVECQICDLTFTNAVDSREHFQSADHETAMYAQRVPNAPMHFCEACGKLFSTALRLERHMRSHTGHRPFVCTTCGKCFSQKSTLTKHFISKHTNVRSYVCPFCQRSFALKHNMDAHVRRTHGVKENVVTVDSHNSGQRARSYLLRL